MSFFGFIVVVVLLARVLAAPVALFDSEASAGEKFFGFCVLIVEIFFVYIFFIYESPK